MTEEQKIVNPMTMTTTSPSAMTHAEMTIAETTNAETAMTSTHLCETSKDRDAQPDVP